MNPGLKEYSANFGTRYLKNLLFSKGDLEREKGLPISYLCDRFSVNTAKS